MELSAWPSLQTAVFHPSHCHGVDIASSIDILYIAAFRVLDIQCIVTTTELEIDLRQAGGRSDSRGLIIVGYLRLVGAFARVDSFDLSHHRA